MASPDPNAVVIERRYCGPPSSGNGGYTAGLAAAPLLALGPRAVEVTLRVPPPLDRPLARHLEGPRSVLLDGDTVVAEAVALDETPTLAVPAPPSVEAAEVARSRYGWVDNHPFPSCFVCGTGRAGEGLEIHAGPVDAGTGPEGLHAAPWTPAADLGDDDGSVRSEILWAALDCPSSAPVVPVDYTNPSVLGRLTVTLHRPARVGEPHVVVAWPVALDGRKRTGAAALYTAGGELVGTSLGLWIELRPPR